MFAKLYLALLITPELDRALKSVSEALLEQFTQGGESYLQIFEHQGKQFIGKAIGGHLALSRLELLQDNVQSLIGRLLPQFSVDGGQLALIATLD